MGKLSQYANKLKDYQNSFGFKIFSAFITVILPILFIFSLLQVYHESRIIKENLIKQGEMVSAFLSGSSKAAVFAGNTEALKNIIDGVLKEEEILSVAIYSPDLNVLYEKHKRLLKEGLAGPYSEITAELSGLKTFKIMETPEVIECLNPIFIDVFPNPVESLYYEHTDNYPNVKTIGYVRVTIDKTIQKNAIKRTFFSILALAFAISLSGIVIIYAAVKKVTKPLTKLTESVRLFGIEGLVKKIELESDDEFGKLAKAFNKMAEDLRWREDEKNALEDQLIQSKKMEALGTLSRGIAHDFNNILSTIKGASFILKNKLDENSPLQQYIQKVHTSLVRADNLIKGLLAFSRGQVTNPHPVDINMLIKKLAPFCKNLADIQTQCTFTLCDEDLLVMGDHTQLEQVLLNFISNAFDAMPEGGLLAITTDTSSISSLNKESCLSLIPGEYVTISFSDTGTGIREELASRIFEPFFTTKEQGKGTGLGLSIAYGIINEYKGQLVFSTQIGAGTTFTVYLPRFKASLPA